jgi:hypothetical protein
MRFLHMPIIVSSALIMALGCGGEEESNKASSTRAAAPTAVAPEAAAPAAKPEAAAPAAKPAAAAPAAKPAANKPSTPMVSATVTLRDKKPNGKTWDAMYGAPDVALCYVAGGTKTCIPGGKSSVEPGIPAHCQDSLTCSFQVPANATEFEIVDIDMASNDPVGAGSCSIGKTCQLGSCKLKLR